VRHGRCCNRLYSGPVTLPARVASAALGGICLTLAFPGYGLWPLAPVGVALATLAVLGARARAGLALGLVTGLAFFVPTLSWAGTDFLGIIPWLGLAVLQSLYFALQGWLSALLARSGGFVGALGVGLAWVAQESLRSRTPYGGFPWVRLAFSQADSPLGRWAALGGAPFATFGTALVGALLAVAGHTAYRRLRLRGGRLPAQTPPPRSPLRYAVPALVLGAVGLLVPLPVDGPTARVLAVQGNVPRPGLDFNAERRAVLDNHARETLAALARRGAAGAPPLDLIVWPENSSDIDPVRNLDAGAVIQSAVQRAGVPIVVGALFERPDEIANVSVVYRPDIGITDTYVKQHPVPFAEYIPHRDFYRHLSASVDLLRVGMAIGPGPEVFTMQRAGGPRVLAGPSICFEVAYDDLVRTNVTEGSTLLLVQTNNATFGASHESVQQLAISRIRAIEHGRSVVHVSTVGVSALIRPDGSLIEPTTLFTAAALDADLPLRESRTLATTLGPAPEYLGCVVALLLLARALWARRSGKESPSS